jgi:hypothetical protein
MKNRLKIPGVNDLIPHFCSFTAVGADIDMLAALEDRGPELPVFPVFPNLAERLFFQVA